MEDRHALRRDTLVAAGVELLGGEGGPAHTVRAVCDEIIVMEQGNVVERGTHEELMKNGGAYTRLVSNE